LQVKRTRQKEASDALRGFVLQPVLTKRVLKGVSRSALHFGKYVRVGVQGDGYCGVSQHL
jgi:hypothetical protein